MTIDEFRARWKHIVWAQGRTLSWVAKKTDRETQTVHMYSAGLRRPTEAWLRAVAELIGVEVA